MTLKSLLTRIGHSPYLADLRDKYPEDCATLKDLQNLAHKSLKALENLQGAPSSVAPRSQSLENGR